MLNNKYPDYKTYEKQYKRFFAKGVDYLVDLVPIKKTDKCLDLCGGGGRLTKKLKELSDYVVYVDQEKDMTPKNEFDELGIKYYNLDVSTFVSKLIGFGYNKFNYVFCEQAVNYWLKHINIEEFANLFYKGGKFIFNTFSKRPSEKPMVREDEIDDVKYVEVNTLVTNNLGEEQVHHVQFCEGMTPHFTVFDWISEKEYRKKLSPYFNIELHDNGKSAIYVCTRK